MAGKYQGTAVEFTDQTLEEFRKEVLQTAYLGDPNSGFGEQELQSLATRYDSICVRLKSMIAAYGLSHRGPDSDAAQARLGELVTLGENGIAKLRSMAGTLSQMTPAFKQLHDQLEPLTTMDDSLASTSAQVASPPVRPLMQGLPPSLGGGAAPVVPAGQGLLGMMERHQAEFLATEYQTTSNQSLETSIPVFEPPPAQQFGTQQGPPLTTTGVGGGLGAPVAGASSAGLAPAGAPLPPEVPGTPGGGAGGAGSGGVGNLAQQTASAPLAPAANLGRRSTPGTSPGSPGIPGSLGGSTGRSTDPRSPAGLDGVSGVGARGLPAGGVIRPETPRGVSPDELLSPRARPGGTIGPEGEPRAAIPRGNTPGAAHQPMMPAAGMGGAGRGGSSRRRPDWLIEPDPDSYWLADVPPHLPGVLRPTADIDDFDDR